MQFSSIVVVFSSISLHLKDCWVKGFSLVGVSSLVKRGTTVEVNNKERVFSDEKEKKLKDIRNSD